jgi:hypothetical protein
MTSEEPLLHGSLHGFALMPFAFSLPEESPR